MASSDERGAANPLLPGFIQRIHSGADLLDLAHCRLLRVLAHLDVPPWQGPGPCGRWVVYCKESRQWWGKDGGARTGSSLDRSYQSQQHPHIDRQSKRTGAMRSLPPACQHAVGVLVAQDGHTHPDADRGLLSQGDEDAVREGRSLLWTLQLLISIINQQASD